MAEKFLKWGIYIIIFFLPAYLIRFKVFGIPTTVLEIMIYAFFAFWLISGRRLSESVKTIKNNRLLFWVVFLILAGVILSTLRSWDLRLSMGILKAWFFDPIMFFVVLASVIKSQEEIKKCFYAFVFSGAVVSAASLIYLFLGKLNVDGRLEGFYNSPNYLAMYLGPILIVVLGFLVQTYRLRRSSQTNQIFSNHEVGPIDKIMNVSAASISRPENKVYQKDFTRRGSGLRYGFRKFVGLLGSDFYFKFLILNSVFLILILFCTGSFGAWMGVFGGFGFGLIVWLWDAKKRKTAVILAILLIILCVGLYFVKFSTIQGRLSINSRLEIWQRAIYGISTYPIIGIGPGTFKDFFPEESSLIAPQPHSLYLAFLLQAGIIGFIGFVLLLVWFYGAGIKNYGSRIMSIILMSAMACILIHGMVDTTYWKNDLSVLFWVIVGLMLVLSRPQSGSR